MSTLTTSTNADLLPSYAELLEQVQPDHMEARWHVFLLKALPVLPPENLLLRKAVQSALLPSGKFASKSEAQAPDSSSNDPKILEMQLEAALLAPPRWRAFLLRALPIFSSEDLPYARHALMLLRQGIVNDDDAPDCIPGIMPMLLQSALAEKSRPPTNPAKLRFPLDGILSGEMDAPPNVLQSLADDVRAQLRESLVTSTTAESCGKGLTYLAGSWPTFVLPSDAAGLELLGPSIESVPLVATCLQVADKGLVALYTKGDGNCLFHAASLGMVGVHDERTREGATKEGEGKGGEGKGGEGKEGEGKEGEVASSLRGTLREATYRSLRNCPKLRTAIEAHRTAPIEDELALVERDRCSVGNVSIYALANVLRRPIVCLCACQHDASGRVRVSDALYVKKLLELEDKLKSSTPRTLRSPSTEESIKNNVFYVQEMMNGVYLPNLWEGWDDGGSNADLPPPLLVAYVPGHFVCVAGRDGCDAACRLVLEHNVDVCDDGKVRSWQLPVRFPSDRGAEEDRERFLAMYNSEKYRKGALEESTAKGEEGLVLAATAFRAELVRVLTHGGGIHEYLLTKRSLFAEYKK